MKKIFAILLTLCLMAGVLCITAFAADEIIEDAPAAGTVLRVRGLKNDGTTMVKIDDFDNFQGGWNYAMELAEDEDYMEDNEYERIVVDLYADWTDVNKSSFGSGRGFAYGAIYFRDGVKLTLNMNGHTINRGLTKRLANGEVMYIDEEADVIINDGTVTGGYSNNGAGGIHIMDDASVTLNNVNIVGNRVYEDDGAGIAIYDDATLTMNGGSFKNNEFYGETYCFGVAVYVNDSTATFDGVEFKNNYGFDEHHYGAAIYAEDSKVFVNNCLIDGNGKKDDTKSILATYDTIHAEDSTVNVKKSTFTGNGDLYTRTYTNANNIVNLSDFSSIITLDSESTLTIEDDCQFSGNTAYTIIRAKDDDKFYVSNSTFTDNAAGVLSSADHSENSFFRNCVFNKNSVPGEKNSYSFNVLENVVTFYDCDLGDSTFDKSDEAYIKYAISAVTEAEALITVKALLADGTIASTAHYKDISGGWNAAMDLAVTGAYDRIVVDLLTDWNAVGGKFGSSEPGFKWNAIYIPANVHFTFNMNGHTVNRGLTDSQSDGEVIYVDKGADIIINDGTVTGGFSTNGAGGIHVMDGAKLTLNNVNVVGNTVKGDDGAGIALYNGAVLTMDGGSISRNSMDRIYILISNIVPYGALYVDNSTAILNKVTISDNDVKFTESEGAAIYAKDSTVTMNECTVSGNAVHKDTTTAAHSVIVAYNSALCITDTDFTGNATSINIAGNSASSLLFGLNDSSLVMNGGKITGNNPDELFDFKNSDAEISNVTITDNKALVMQVMCNGPKVTVTKCVFGNNVPDDSGLADIRVSSQGALAMIDCTLGDTNFSNKDYVDFGDGTGTGATASIFGEGSVAMIVAIVAIIAAGAAIWVSVSSKKALVVGNTDSAEENDAAEDSKE